MEYIENALQFSDLEHDCSNYLRLCIRPIGEKGGSSYVNQCLFCGDQRGGAISKASISPPKYFFDFTLPEKYREKHNEILKKTSIVTSVVLSQPALSFECFSGALNDFGQGLKEQYGINDALLKGYFSRFLNSQREDHKNAFESSFCSELELQEWLRKKLCPWFEVYSEVKGQGFINRKIKNIRIDFVIKAKPALLEEGFTDKPIGIEVKYFNPSKGDGFQKKVSRGIFQALSYWYSGARWDIDDSCVELAAVLIFSNLSFTSERDYLFDTLDSHYKKLWSAVFGVANHANVGEFIFDGSPQDFFKWRMNFSTATYFTGYQNGDIKMGNSNLIEKVRIGSMND